MVKSAACNVQTPADETRHGITGVISDSGAAKDGGAGEPAKADEALAERRENVAAGQKRRKQGRRGKDKEKAGEVPERAKRQRLKGFNKNM